MSRLRPRPTRRVARCVAFATCMIAGACAAPTAAPSDAQHLDAHSVRDAAARDARTVALDASAHLDGSSDAANFDADRADARPFDGALLDARLLDAGPPDTGPSDAGPRCDEVTLPPLTGREIGSFVRPLFLASAPGDRGALYVMEAQGRILRVAPDGTRTIFLDIRPLIIAPPELGSEYGLLGMAFHPGYAESGRFFIAYTPRGGGDNVIAEYVRSTATPPVAVATPVRTLVRQPDPEGNHNGGMLAFGRDGFLYASLGDGGGGNDMHGEFGNGLNLMTLHGKLLRLDVDNAAGSFAAAGNPFADGRGLPQIWAYGLRNPWRFSFDRATGDLYLGDVGQIRVEEIDFQPASSRGGENYGWRAYEGNEVFDRAVVDRVPTHAAPVLTYLHFGGESEALRAACAVTGGYVYRGSAIPGLVGVYLYGDYCSGDIGAFRMCDGVARGVQRVAGLGDVVSRLGSFAEDEDGELYLLSTLGPILKIVPR